MGSLGTAKTRRETLIGSAAAGLLLLVLANCTGRPEGRAGDLLDLRNEIARKLPANWKISTVKDVPFPVLPPAKPDDLIVWRTKPVVFEKPRSVSATTRPVYPPYVYYTLTLHDWIELDKYPAILKANDDLRKQHEYYQAQLASIPRTAEGQYKPRGDAESSAVKQYKPKLDALPPFERHLPTHYYNSLSIKLHDWRTTLVPEDRDTQQEQNQVMAVFNEVLKKYPTR